MGGSPFWLAVRAGWIYWAAQGLWRAPVAGGLPVLLAATNLPLGPVAVDETRAYVAEGNPGEGVVARVPKTGGAPEILASGRHQPTCVAVDGESVYWSEQGEGAIFKLAK